MLSYQHLYHAGNPADVHKHAALAWMLSYLTQKPKPISYIETHAGRGLYDLGSAEAARTGEAAPGVEALLPRFPTDHPYARAVTQTRQSHGPRAYPGSPAIATALLRDGDSVHLAELHPGEHDHLRRAMRGSGARVHRADGLDLALSLAPPEPRRGLMLIDPSYEVKADYTALPRVIGQIARAWPVGVIVLWYPLLRDPAHLGMLTALGNAYPEGLRHEVRFPPVRAGHRMCGSGLFVLNPPWGRVTALDTIAAVFDRPRG